MTELDVVMLARDMIWITLVLSAPILVVGMVVGLVISLIQALTQINEQTLAFVPKLVVTSIAIILLTPWMMSKLMRYTCDLIDLLPYLTR